MNCFNGERNEADWNAHRGEERTGNGVAATVVANLQGYQRERCREARDAMGLEIAMHQNNKRIRRYAYSKLIAFASERGIGLRPITAGGGCAT